MKKKKIELINIEYYQSLFIVDKDIAFLLGSIEIMSKLNEVISLLNDDDKRKRKEDKSSVQIPHN